MTTMSHQRGFVQIIDLFLLIFTGILSVAPVFGGWSAEVWRSRARVDVKPDVICRSIILTPPPPLTHCTFLSQAQALLSQPLSLSLSLSLSLQSVYSERLSAINRVIMIFMGTAA